MCDYLFKAVYCFCVFQLGFCEKCSNGVLGRSQTFYAPEGSSMTLSCVVQHCGENWTGNWTYKKLTNATSGTVGDGGKHHFSHLALSNNETQLNLTIRSVGQSDAGSYKCSVIWEDGSRDEGHWMHLNVTKEVPVQRNALHRFLICAGAFFWLPVFLLLARRLGSKVKPHTRPRTQVIYEVVQEDRSHQLPQPLTQRPVPKKRTNPPRKVSSKPLPKTELVYADISQETLRQQRAMREPAQSTVYSSVHFSSATHQKNEGSV
ncbi:uncharacterized protein si:dkey-52l18.4 [Austrofundulus limnaeus]|uniref:Uncharacterized protein si:dkey-52l18.4 n=1 Tax=Austrofundulus limnaeus TaxID=52670 RepID=A0A2I4CDC8_AUSLI|nr:PREDICTED: uncharacterized protein LOC106527598 [Austrofundulus limnaeus]